MLEIERQVRDKMAGYRKKGSKVHRSQMIDLAVRAVLDMSAHSQATRVEHLGSDHVRHYWKALRLAGKAYKTQMSHWYALAHLWAALGRTEPPRPWQAAGRPRPSG